jgi:hypothetical protein
VTPHVTPRTTPSTPHSYSSPNVHSNVPFWLFWSQSARNHTPSASGAVETEGGVWETFVVAAILAGLALGIIGLFASAPLVWKRVTRSRNYYCKSELDEDDYAS